ncbi:hypothetical protein ACIBCT_35815 [Streptosporangium sp. NPDC050855]|uniref:phage terminase large subunit family protein n=1 Tax=Streptosporangium sp. NPDC050855 TaxID=3366194 RepID=UPI0037A16DC7
MEQVDEEYFDEELTDETEAERQARLDTEVVLDELSAEFVSMLVDKMMVIVDTLSGHPLYEYQRPFARRLIESVIIGDGATITALFSRQSGKSETVANVVAALMIMLPVLARIYPDLLGHFKEGLWVGAFAPVDDQADNLYSRIVSRLTSERAIEIMAEPEINDALKGKGRTVTLRSGSLVRRQTCHPRAIIEGRTYHLILIDECQGADDKMVNKSIAPMGASTNATMCFTGTPSYEKNVFYKAIQLNKRLASRRGSRVNHFEADWKAAAKANARYGKYVKKEILRVGEDSDEFKLSFRLMWLLEKGMFTTREVLDSLGDKSMEVVKYWHQTPVVVGIDPARKQDSTIVTVVWVDWDRPDEFGMYEHRVLNWLDLEGMEWEAQYYRITEFLSSYNVFAIGVDVGGVGDAVASRLKVLMPRANIVEMGSMPGDQSKRWKHLNQLLERRMIGWPAHAKARRLRTYRRFVQQMEDLQVEFKGPNMLAEAPNETGAFDDYADSLALACVLTQETQMPVMEVANNPFY